MTVTTLAKDSAKVFKCSALNTKFHCACLSFTKMLKLFKILVFFVFGSFLIEARSNKECSFDCEDQEYFPVCASSVDQYVDNLITIPKMKTFQSPCQILKHNCDYPDDRK